MELKARMLPETIIKSDVGWIIHTPPQEARMFDPMRSKLVEMTIVGYRIVSDPMCVSPIVCCSEEDGEYVQSQLSAFFPCWQPETPKAPFLPLSDDTVLYVGPEHPTAVALEKDIRKLGWFPFVRKYFGRWL